MACHPYETAYGESNGAVNRTFDPAGESIAVKQAIISALPPQSYIILLLQLQSLLRQVRKYNYAMSLKTGSKNQQVNHCVFHDANYWRWMAHPTSSNLLLIGSARHKNTIAGNIFSIGNACEDGFASR